MVLAFPHWLAAITFPLPEATSRIEVTKNSRNKIIITATALTKSSCTKHTKAEATKILSASGSANFPKSALQTDNDAGQQATAKITQKKVPIKYAATLAYWVYS